jgi:hypothetical protein
MDTQPTPPTTEPSGDLGAAKTTPARGRPPRTQPKGKVDTKDGSDLPGGLRSGQGSNDDPFAAIRIRVQGWPDQSAFERSRATPRFARVRAATTRSAADVLNVWYRWRDR